MKKLVLCLAMLAPAMVSEGTIHIVNTSGFTFTPMAIQILAGDTIDFTNIGGSHNVVEVSQATYNANQSTPLPGGFSAPFGGSMVLTAGFTQGMHYYICSPHISSGMKGTVNVIGTVGVDASALPQLIISARPNPFTTSLMIQAPGVDVFEVYSTTGQMVFTDKVDVQSGKYLLEAAALPRGLYVFRFLKEQAVVGTRKVVRQ